MSAQGEETPTPVVADIAGEGGGDLIKTVGGGVEGNAGQNCEEKQALLMRGGGHAPEAPCGRSPSSRQAGSSTLYRHLRRLGHARLVPSSRKDPRPRCAQS